jgi:hypothetical protein
VRFNALSRAIESALQKEGISSRVLGGHKFFERAEVLTFFQILVFDLRAGLSGPLPFADQGSSGIPSNNRQPPFRSRIFASCQHAE